VLITFIRNFEGASRQYDRKGFEIRKSFLPKNALRLSSAESIVTKRVALGEDSRFAGRETKNDLPIFPHKLIVKNRIAVSASKELSHQNLIKMESRR
jgi:hypothetical protein